MELQITKFGFRVTDLAPWGGTMGRREGARARARARGTPLTYSELVAGLRVAPSALKATTHSKPLFYLQYLLVACDPRQAPYLLVFLI